MQHAPRAAHVGGRRSCRLGMGTFAQQEQEPRTVKEEKPRSRVMPRSLLCGCLSSAAVDSVVDSAATARGERGWMAGGRRQRRRRRRRRHGGRPPESAALTQGRLAAIHMPQDTDVDVEGARGGRSCRLGGALGGLALAWCRWCTRHYSECCMVRSKRSSGLDSAAIGGCELLMPPTAILPGDRIHFRLSQNLQVLLPCLLRPLCTLRAARRPSGPQAAPPALPARL